MADAAGDVEVSLGAVLLPHVAVQLATVSEAHWCVVQVAHDASVSDLGTWAQIDTAVAMICTWTIVGLKSFLFTEKLHTDRAVRNLNRIMRSIGNHDAKCHLFIRMPGAEVGEQIVLLIEIQGTDEALEFPPKTDWVSG